MSPSAAAPVVVVGAGIAGASCARELRAAGHEVRLLDRGHRVGGRMASRTLAGRPVDLGASYFTVTDPAYDEQVQDWRERGLARVWTDRFTVLERNGDEVTASIKEGPERWGAAGGLRSLVEDLVDGTATQATVTSVDRDGSTGGSDAQGAGLLVDGDEAAAVVLAMPDAQAARVLGAGLGDVEARLDRPFEPVLALAAWWPERTWDEVSPDGRFHGAFVNGDDVVAWIADDGRRRGDDAPCLVAHSTGAFAARHLEDPEAAEGELVRALRRLLGLGAPAGSYVQRWSLAKPTGDREAAYLVSEPGAGAPLGICGDGWGASSKVETAWLSGRALGQALSERLS